MKKHDNRGAAGGIIDLKKRYLEEKYVQSWWKKTRINRQNKF